MTRPLLTFPPFALDLTPANRLHFHLADQIGSQAYELDVLSPASMTDLLDLADQFQDAASKLRAIVSEADPGRAFEENLSLQFGAQKLEGDL